MRELEEKIRQLETACRAVLEAHPAGLSEHDLLQHLRKTPHQLMPQLALDDSLGLFQSHFLLFHVLYRLRDTLWQEQGGELAISPLLIRLQSYTVGEAGLGQCDPLRDYYLDLAQLEQTGKPEVEELLSGFWQCLDAGGDRQEALAVLELAEPVTLSEIKAQYRRLAMRHHPDRGGDGEQMHALNDALATLQRYYS
jgi:DnaJ-domain-containing protein 1